MNQCMQKCESKGQQAAQHQAAQQQQQAAQGQDMPGQQMLGGDMPVLEGPCASEPESTACMAMMGKPMSEPFTQRYFPQPRTTIYQSQPNNMEHFSQPRRRSRP